MKASINKMVLDITNMTPHCITIAIGAILIGCYGSGGWDASNDIYIDDIAIDDFTHDLDMIDQDIDGEEYSATPGFLLLHSGSFTMGSPVSEPGRFDDETQHIVTLTHSFEIQRYEVTQDQFRSLMGYNNSQFAGCGGNCPVEFVSWQEAAAYCNELSAEMAYDQCYSCTGEGTSIICNNASYYLSPYECPGYRLPTESEWEYATRANTTDGTYGGTVDNLHINCETPNTILDPIAWYCGNSTLMTHNIEIKAPNTYGLFDMLGNVWEWTSDWYDEYPTSCTDPFGPNTGTIKVMRGGSWQSGANAVRSSMRGMSYIDDPFMRQNEIGFRPVRSM